MVKSKKIVGFVVFVAVLALAPASFGQTDVNNLTGVGTAIAAGYEVSNCRATTHSTNITVCDTSDSTLPLGSVLINQNSGITCVLNARSIPIWGHTSNGGLDFTELMAQCDELSSSIQNAASEDPGPVVTVDAFPEFRYTATSSLPTKDREFTPYECNHQTYPVTLEGQAVAEHGWAVLSEIAISKYTLVSFAGKLERFTSSICHISEGNIAIFEDQLLTGIIYTANPEDELISWLDIQEGGRVRVFNGAGIHSPIADLVIRPGSISLEPIASYTSYCSGQELVPNIYGMDIREARLHLFEAGWSPTLPEDEIEQRFLWSSPYQEGIFETRGCSGTGVNYCGYAYQNLGAELNVTSAGEIAFFVVNFDVTCPD